MAKPATLPRRYLPAALGAAFIGVNSADAEAANNPTEINFSTAGLGQIPPGFVAARTGNGAQAEWRIVEDATVTGGRVLAQTSSDQTDYRFPMAIYEPLSAANIDVLVHFKAVAGRVDRAAGIAIRLADVDNYYVVRANALEDNVNFYCVVKGSRREITGASAKVTPDIWHTLGLRADGETFTISLDAKILFTTKDRTFANAGKVALWTKADSVTRFDALSIRTLP
jgi:hypothetical protein